MLESLSIQHPSSRVDATEIKEALQKEPKEVHDNWINPKALEEEVNSLKIIDKRLIQRPIYQDPLP